MNEDELVRGCGDPGRSRVFSLTGMHRDTSILVALGLEMFSDVITANVIRSKSLFQSIFTRSSNAMLCRSSHFSARL